MHLHEELLAEGVTDGRHASEYPLANMVQLVGGVFYADDAAIVSRSSKGLAKLMVVIVEVGEQAYQIACRGRRLRSCRC